MVAIRLHNPPVDEPLDSAADCDPKVAVEMVDKKIGELEELLDDPATDLTPKSGPGEGEESAIDVHNDDSSPPVADADSSNLQQWVGDWANGKAGTVSQSIKLVRAKTRYLAASLALSELEQKRDTIKSRIKSQKEILKELYAEVLSLGGGDGDGDDDDDYEGDEDGENGDAGADDGDEPTMASDGSGPTRIESWAVTPTSSIGLDSIKGMGAKKLTAIYEAAPTLGKLESLRADVYSGGLTQIQGVGTAMADAIEDVILKWLTENRDSEVLGFAGGGDGASDQVADQVSDQVSDQVAEQDSQEPSRGGDASDPTADNSAGECDASSESIAAAFPQVDEPAVADAEPEAADAPAQPVGPPKKPKRAKSKAAAPRHSAPPPACLPDHLTDDDRGDLTARSALIRSRYLDGQFADTEATDEFSDGRDARCRDLAIADACNWMPGEKQDQWLLGWVAADLEIAGVGNHDAQTVGA